MQKSEKMPEWDGDRVVTHVSSQDMRPRERSPEQAPAEKVEAAQ